MTAGRFPGLLGELARFAAAGIGNTLVTLAVYQIAVGALGPVGAYCLAWAVGIGLVMAVYPRFVFRRGGDWGQGLLMGAVYLVAFVAGWLVTRASAAAGVPDRPIVFLALAVTASLSYLGGRYGGLLLAGRDRG